MGQITDNACTRSAVQTFQCSLNKLSLRNLGQNTIPMNKKPLHDLIPFVQFKKHEKYPWRSVVFHGSLSRFLICTKGIKSRKASPMNTRWGKEQLFEFRTNIAWLNLQNCNGIPTIVK